MNHKKAKSFQEKNKSSNLSKAAKMN